MVQVLLDGLGCMTKVLSIEFINIVILFLGTVAMPMSCTSMLAMAS